MKEKNKEKNKEKRKYTPPKIETHDISSILANWETELFGIPIAIS